jgi:1-pyrroline-5-carboxylate dehydrogenase
MWNTIASNLPQYKSYPRIVGETGGKDFVFAHPSADVDALAVALVRGSFEYQGQKCSAASRGYIPKSLWPAVKERVVAEVEAIRMGSPLDFRNFMAAVIDENSYDNTMGYIDFARRKSNEAQIVVGGSGDKATGYFVEPTVVLTSNPHFKLMEEEIFAPVLTLFVYDDRDFDATLALCDTTSPYALTGAIFARDRAVIGRMATCAAPLGGQLLHQRQADRRGRRAAAVRRRARLRHQRQGGRGGQPDALDLDADDEGDLRLAAGSRYPHMAEE